MFGNSAHVRLTESLNYRQSLRLELQGSRADPTAVFWRVFYLPMLSKQDLRLHIRQQRHCLGIQALKRRERQMTRLLLQVPALQKSQHIAAYWPNDGEISPLAALFHWQRHNKQVYLPVIRKDLHLDFRLWLPGQPLVKNRFGIPEPATKLQRHPGSLDAVLLPLVAFDQKGRRLGMGGGFYDRSFAFKRKRLWSKRPLLIGIAHDFQQVPQLPEEPWDIPLDMIITNHQILDF